MAIAESLIPEFNHEMKTTRTLLERVPEEKANWQPHQKIDVSRQAYDPPGDDSCMDNFNSQCN